MDAELSHLLEELYEEGQSNDVHEQERRRKLLNLEPDTAHFLSILVRSGQRKHTGGHVISIDREAEKQEQADTNLRRAGLRTLVELRRGDATEIVAGLSGPFDFVFFDADRLSAPAQLALLVPKLAEDVVICADNVHSHPEEIASYLQAITALPDFDHMLVPVGKGLSLAYRGKTSNFTPASM